MYRSKLFILILLCLALAASACTSAATTTPASSAPAQQQQSAPSAPAAATATTAPTNTPVPTATTAPTETPAPQAASGADCLVGTWAISDFSQYFASIMVKIKTPFTISDQSGNLSLTFGADGKATMNANQWKVTLTGNVEKVPLTIVISVNGAAHADYTAADGKIVFTNRTNDNMIMSSTVNGQQLFSGTSDELAGMFGVSGSNNAYNSFPYECAGNVLQYTPPIANAQPVILKRVQ